ncbi:LysM peptidoglycan-binding domain-containing protein [Streptomyces sp. PTM05]|uniref:LysM peptidoglycan-binding domain-containing protein n=1 Tax=Streptantibioticus parmotrematis TaxID=2873249 RepID=A0ABS7R3B2_9ACTN|nr:LysM peptidoglycan-binding domain-containing protein [Streptantibioticus parmotrematis]MBY8889426.1 LysM peptidoglycan-binding domain-containing protein [Streptantibioticus parmotrematis]
MPQPSPRPARRGRTLATALRALASLVTLAACLVGLPVVLGWGTSAVAGPGIAALGNLLTTQDSGQVFLLALAVAGWIGWALFAAAVLLEIPAQVRGRTAPQLRLLVGQRAAATLVSALLLALPTGTALASPGPAQAATVASAPQHITSEHTVARSEHRDAFAGTTYTVRQTRPAESLWSIADSQLGDGARWEEIAHLNDGRTMTDGSIFRADAPIQPGWTLRLPADARHATSPAKDGPSTQDTATRATTYTVHADDTLSQIAEHQLGDADQWPQIYALNHDQVHDPDLIYPGEHLTLPAQTTSPDPATSSSPEPAPGPSSGTDTTPPPVTPPAAAPDTTSATPPSNPAPSVVAPSATSTPTTPPATADTPTAQTPTASTPYETAPTAHTQHATSESESTTGLFALGGALLAASVLTALGARRILQQRRRRPGRRIAMPTSTAATTEQAMRTVAAPDGITIIDATLRTAAVHLAADGRELPELGAACYQEHGLTLYLTEPAAPVAPFSAVDGDLARWHAPASTNELLPDHDIDNADAPYPALVTIGVTETGETVLVDLERFALVRIGGPRRQPVLRALAVELATTTLADHLDLTLLGSTCPGLADLLPERCSQHPDPADAVGAVASHHLGQQQAMTAAGAESLRQARLGPDTTSAWTPHLVLGDHDDLSDDHLQDLIGIALDSPRTATTLLTTSTATPSTPGDATWDIITGAGVAIPGTSLVCTLQELSDQDYTDVLDIIATSAIDTPDVPAPANSPRLIEHIPVQDTPDHHTSPTPGPATTDEATPAAARPTAVEREEQPDEAEGLMAAFADLGPDDGNGNGNGSDDALLPHLTTAGSPASHSPAEPDHGASADSAPTAAEGPVVRVLGPVDIVGTGGTTEQRYLRVLTEIAAWMVLHPGRDHLALDEAIWPGREVSRKTRNPWISRLRGWLGTAPDGSQHLPPIATTADARYRLANSVTSDWQQFQALVAEGTNDALHQALRLVRGRPFAAVRPRRYVWAEPLIQEMISAIVDVAAELGNRYLGIGDPRGALWAATNGLDAAPEAEQLHRILFRAHHALGDREALERAVLRLDDLNTALGCDMDDETADLLDLLLATTQPPTRP